MTLTKTRKVVLFTGYSCNNRCGFCIDFDKREIPDQTTRTLVAEIARVKAAGADYLELIGGEASIRSDFLSLVRAARSVGFKEIVTATNGRRFAYPEFAREAVESGLTAIIFSIHGHDDPARRSDLIPGSFRQLRAVANLKALGFDHVYANTTVPAEFPVPAGDGATISSWGCATSR